MSEHNHSVDREIKKDHFRVTIFGSARIKKDDEIYQQVFNLAKEIGKHNFDIVTGGGPGIMEAANAGHQAGSPQNSSHSIGLPIDIPNEIENRHLDIQTHFKRFSDRLNHFMDLSNVVVIMPGGVGTCLEFLYTWQLIQVKHIKPLPIILFGEMWESFIDWLRAWPLKKGLISTEDFTFIHIAKNNDEALKMILFEYDVLHGN